jgi:hypothetical protein
MDLVKQLATMILTMPDGSGHAANSLDRITLEFLFPLNIFAHKLLTHYKEDKKYESSFKTIDLNIPFYSPVTAEGSKQGTNGFMDGFHDAWTNA